MAVNKRIKNKTEIETFAVVTKETLDNEAEEQYREMQSRKLAGCPITGEYARNWEKMSLEERKDNAVTSIEFISFSSQDELNKWKSTVKWSEWIEEKKILVRYMRT